MVYIFILKLEDDKYYVGCCNTPDRDIVNYLNGNSSSEWTRKYKPVKLVEMINPCDIFDTDKHTKRYMGLYGVNNVRGGAYQKIRLSKSDYNHIDKEIFTALGMCMHCGSEIHLSKDCYHISFKWQVKNFLNKIKNNCISLKEQIRTCFNNRFYNQNQNRIKRYDTLIINEDERTPFRFSRPSLLLDSPIQSREIMEEDNDMVPWYNSSHTLSFSLSPPLSPLSPPRQFRSSQNKIVIDEEKLNFDPLGNLPLNKPITPPLSSLSLSKYSESGSRSPISHINGSPINNINEIIQPLEFLSYSNDFPSRDLHNLL